MISNEDYQLITKDIAGSRTKNRYIYEVNYGIEYSNVLEPSIFSF